MKSFEVQIHFNTKVGVHFSSFMAILSHFGFIIFYMTPESVYALLWRKTSCGTYMIHAVIGLHGLDSSRLSHDLILSMVNPCYEMLTYVTGISIRHVVN